MWRTVFQEETSIGKVELRPGLETGSLGRGTGDASFHERAGGEAEKMKRCSATCMWMHFKQVLRLEIFFYVPQRSR